MKREQILLGTIVLFFAGMLFVYLLSDRPKPKPLSRAEIEWVAECMKFGGRGHYICATEARNLAEMGYFDQ